MHTLLLRLAGPMQAWGTQSRFLERDTGLEPSRSGVLGLLGAALGVRRDEPIGALADLAMGVRVDREGVVGRDFHTALGVVKADGKPGDTVVSVRYFLADADFLVGLEGEDLALLARLDAALAEPRWPLGLGRRAFPPGLPVRLPGGGVRPDLPLRQALRAEPWWPRPGDPPWRPRPDRLRVVLEATPDRAHARRMDRPWPGTTFAERRFAPRDVEIGFWDLGAPGGVPIGEASDG